MTGARLLGLSACLAAIAGWPPAASLSAADHGQMGETFPIIETDLLSTIEAKLRYLKASGGIEALQRQMQGQAVASVRRPKPVEGLSAATSRREWLFDPSIVTEDDIRDTKGNLIAARGTRVNPLDHVQLSQELVFVNGNSADEVDWALRGWSDLKAKIIFVSGSPFDAMKPHQRRFYFDQGGMLVSRFGIRHTPAVVSAAGPALKVAEIPLARENAAPKGVPAT